MQKKLIAIKPDCIFLKSGCQEKVEIANSMTIIDKVYEKLLTEKKIKPEKSETIDDWYLIINDKRLKNWHSYDWFKQEKIYNSYMPAISERIRYTTNIIEANFGKIDAGDACEFLNAGITNALDSFFHAAYDKVPNKYSISKTFPGFRCVFLKEKMYLHMILSDNGHGNTFQKPKRNGNWNEFMKEKQLNPSGAFYSGGAGWDIKMDLRSVELCCYNFGAAFYKKTYIV